LGRLLNALERKGVLLQVALDFTKVTEALKVVRALSDLSIDVYEVGTPLIKSEGIKAIEVVRAAVGEDKIVLADMKTADTGALEVELAYLAGADVATVLASSDDEVIAAALQKANELGMDIVLDTIGVSDVFGRINYLRALGVRIFNIHTAIDVQKTRHVTVADRITILERIVREFHDIYIAVSGGIGPSNIVELLRIPISIVVVGSAITKSSNPREVAAKIIDIIQEARITRS